MGHGPTFYGQAGQRDIVAILVRKAVLIADEKIGTENDR